MFLHFKYVPRPGPDGQFLIVSQCLVYVMCAFLLLLSSLSPSDHGTTMWISLDSAYLELGEHLETGHFFLFIYEAIAQSLSLSISCSVSVFLLSSWTS